MFKSLIDNNGPTWSEYVGFISIHWVGGGGGCMDPRTRLDPTKKCRREKFPAPSGNLISNFRLSISQPSHFTDWATERMALESTEPLIEMSTRNLPGVQGGRRLRLTTSAQYVSRLCTENVEASTSYNPMGLHDLLQGQFYLFFLIPDENSTGNLIISYISFHIIDFLYFLSYSCSALHVIDWCVGNNLTPSPTNNTHNE
jgi:hypothetical protein